jgi:exportin-1
VHTFYEAVGYMISAQADTVIQEQLIEKYMLLPNQVWDDIISQASKVCIKRCILNFSKNRNL